jgi:hypothetical protein
MTARDSAALCTTLLRIGKGVISAPAVTHQAGVSVVITGPAPCGRRLFGGFTLPSYAGSVALTESECCDRLRPHAAVSADRPTGSFTLGVRRLPVPARGDRAGGALVSAVRVVLPGCGGAAGRARHRGGAATPTTTRANGGRKQPMSYRTTASFRLGGCWPGDLAFHRVRFLLVGDPARVHVQRDLVAAMAQLFG